MDGGTRRGERFRGGWLRGLALALVLLPATACSSAAEKVTDHAAAGDKYAAAGKYPEAVIEYRNAVKLAPGDAELQYKLGQTFLKTGAIADVRAAVQAFRQALAINPDHVGAHLALGRLLLLAGTGTAARDEAQKILDKTPGNVDAGLLKGQALALIKDYDGAAEAFAAVLKDHPDSGSGHLGLATAREGQGRAADAEAEYKRAVAADPNEAAPPMLLAAFYTRQGRTGDAQTILNGVIQHHPDTVPAYLQLARIALAEKRPEAAEAALSGLVDAQPEKAVGYVALGDLQGMLEKTDAAEATYRKGIAKVPDSGDLRIRLASMLLKKGKLDEVDALAKEVGSTPDGQWAAPLLSGLSAMARGHLQDAADLFRKVVAAKPDAALGHYYLGRAQLGLGNATAAGEEFSTAVKADGDFVPARLELARLNLHRGLVDVARTDLKELLRLAPNLPDTLLLQGEMQMADHDAKGAAVTFARFTEAVPDSVDGFVHLGQARLVSGDEKAGETALNRALTLDPSRADALELLVRMDLSHQHAAQAVARIRAQIAQRPDAPALHQLLGRTLADRGDRKGAIVAFQAASKADPAYLPAYSALGTAYAQEGDYDQAIAQLSEAIRRAPDQLGARMLLGITYEKMGAVDKAIETYKAALERSPRYPPAANNLAWLYASGHGNLDVALGLAQGAREQVPDDPSVADTLGWIYYEKGINDRALALFEEALRKMPDDPSILYHAGAASVAAKQPEKARQYLTRALATTQPFAERADAEKVLKGLAGS